MEALIIASRSVIQDKFFQKDQEHKYEKHLNQVTHIQKKPQTTLLQYEEEVNSMTKSLRKAKSAARNFRVREDQVLIKKQNMKLLKKIWDLQPIVDSFHADKFQYVSGSNWSQYKKKQQNIREQNKKIMQRVIELKKVQVQDYKKKLKEQIKDYVERRNSIRKVKKVEKPRRSASEVKMESLLKGRKSTPVIESHQKQQSKQLPKISPKNKEYASLSLQQI